MSLRTIIKFMAILTTVLAVFSNIYIFTYPSLNTQGCSWHVSGKNTAPSCSETSSLWTRVGAGAKDYFTDVYRTQFPKTTSDIEKGEYFDEQVPDLHLLAFGDPQIKGNWPNTPYISRLDTFGNDYYLGHIYRSMVKRLDPSHVVVMGDLFSSQWLSDGEFYNRTKRYVRRLFPGAIPSSEQRIADLRDQQGNHDEKGIYKANWESFIEKNQAKMQNAKANADFGYSDTWKWNDDDSFMFINMTGNHDIGYAGDMTWQHLTRWNDFFGKENFYIEYDLHTDHPWRIVNLNAMMLDGPELQNEFRNSTWEFLYQVFERNFNGSTILLTHIPFAKKEGLCVDGPFFKYYPQDYPNEPYKSGLLRSQNHLTEETSNKVLNLVFHNGKSGIILTGHDHEGCETVYNRYKTKKKATGYSDSFWTCAKDADPKAEQHIQEITVRSMMGNFQGATGLVTGHFNGDDWDWTYTLCKFSIQHVWWATKVVTILAGFFVSLWIIY